MSTGVQRCRYRFRYRLPGPRRRRRGGWAMMGGAEVAVKERPILFSGEMVRALLAGRKTVTRRVVKPQPEHRAVHGVAGLTIGMDPADDGAVWYDADGINPGRPFRSRYGAPLDRLWVRESWWEVVATDGPSCTEPGTHPGRRGAFYRASYPDVPPCPHYAARPSILMPRWASRITLEITNVRVERVQAITEDGARAEGVLPIPNNAGAWRWDAANGEAYDMYRGQFATLWDQLNGPRGYGWDANPWVWVVEFRRLNP